jgi:hypothetical protein
MVGTCSTRNRDEKYSILVGKIQGTRSVGMQKQECVGRCTVDCATAQAVNRRLPTSAAGFEPGKGHVGFMDDKVSLGQVLSEYFCFP